jgi:hypothetical protein
MVAQCSAMTCGHNRQGDCNAPDGIVVRLDGNHADCLTFTENAHHTEVGTQPST